MINLDIKKATIAFASDEQRSQLCNKQSYSVDVNAFPTWPTGQKLYGILEADSLKIPPDDLFNSQAAKSPMLADFLEGKPVVFKNSITFVTNDIVDNSPKARLAFCKSFLERGLSLPCEFQFVEPWPIEARIVEKSIKAVKRTDTSFKCNFKIEVTNKKPLTPSKDLSKYEHFLLHPFTYASATFEKKHFKQCMQCFLDLARKPSELEFNFLIGVYKKDFKPQLEFEKIFKIVPSTFGLMNILGIIDGVEIETYSSGIYFDGLYHKFDEVASYITPSFNSNSTLLIDNYIKALDQVEKQMKRVHEFLMELCKEYPGKQVYEIPILEHLQKKIQTKIQCDPLSYVNHPDYRIFEYAKFLLNR